MEEKSTNIEVQKYRTFGSQLLKPQRPPVRVCDLLTSPDVFALKYDILRKERQAIQNTMKGQNFIVQSNFNDANHLFTRPKLRLFNQFRNESGTDMKLCL